MTKRFQREAIDPIGPSRSQCGVNRQIQRQREYREVAKPNRHCSLKGEGYRDPLIAKGEMPDPEKPAEHESAFYVGRFAYQLDKQREADER